MRVPRIALALATAIAAVLGVPAMSVATPTPPADWFLLTVTGGPKGAFDVQTVLVANGSLDAPGPFVLGMGLATRSGSSLFATQSQTGEMAVTTTRALGGQNVTVQPSPRGGLGLTAAGAIGNLAPGESVSLLYALSSTQLALRHAGAYAASGSASASVVSGRGTRALVLAEKAGDGAAATVASVGAGTPLYAPRSERGLVGAFAPCGGVCVAEWRSPDARSGRYSEAVAVRDGVPGFFGPAGAWSLSWTGAAVSTNLSAPPAVGVVAPIGDSWKLFAPRR